MNKTDFAVNIKSLGRCPACDVGWKTQTASFPRVCNRKCNQRVIEFFTLGLSDAFLTDPKLHKTK